MGVYFFIGNCSQCGAMPPRIALAILAKQNAGFAFLLEDNKKLKEVLLDTGKEYKTLEIASTRFFKNLVIVKFKGIDNINDIEQYKGHDLYVTRENAIPLEEGEYYLADIIDAKVVTEEGEDVLETGANLVYVVEHEGKEVLLPVIPECVKNVDVSAGIVTVHIMKGLV